MVSSLEEHIGYFSDSARIEQFKAAVARVVNSGDLVADVGCGSGILGLLCLQAGAERVWGIDSSSMIEAARESISRAGLADRYVCIREHSKRVILNSKVDVVICDHVGFFGFDYGIIDTMQDARRRFLKPGGRLIPSRMKLMLGLVQSDRCYRIADAWGRAPVPDELRWLRKHSINSKHAVKLATDEILSEPVALGVIDFNADNPEFFSFDATFEIARDGVIHGLAGWFDCELADGVWMTNSPISPQAIRRNQAFLPIDTPLPVKQGDVLRARVTTRPSDNLITWMLAGPTVEQRFTHDTWTGTLVGEQDLARSLPDRVPRLHRTGQARRIVLDYCDGKRTAREIEQAVLRDHPDLFPSPAEIGRFVATALERDTESTAERT